ncbi:MAG: hypothetical protein IKS41_04410 [Alphaproteobacteria bacterium]|nr:hypothetical protein [Alphaproteobacteria bacterium]
MRDKITVHMQKIGKFLLFMGVLYVSSQAIATSYSREDLTCSACGGRDSYPVLMSTNQLSPGSLDSRRGEMMRSALIHLIQQCKSCGLVSYNIAEKVCDKQNEIVKSNAYQTLLKSQNVNELSQKYLAYAYLLEQCGKDGEEVARAYLNAAWAADDADETENAIQFRKKTISYLENSSVTDTQLLLLDLYRRTSQFQKAIDLISKIKVDGNNENACFYKGIINHQKELLKAKNTNDQRMLPPVYCPPEDGSDKEIIGIYIESIGILNRSGDLQEVQRLQFKLIPYLENKTDFLNKFLLTYLYYRTNQTEKAQVLEKELTMPDDWNGFFNISNDIYYGNWVLVDIDDYLSKNSVPDTPFYRLARQMLDVRHKNGAPSPNDIEELEKALDSISEDL